MVLALNRIQGIKAHGFTVRARTELKKAEKTGPGRDFPKLSVKRLDEIDAAAAPGP
jgi:hypothetical protein